MKLILLSIILFSCSGYKLRKRVNPFEKYGIKSIAIPAFYNNTALPNISHFFTQEFTEQMYKIKSLDVINNWSGKVADAYLVGVLNGSKSYEEAYKRELSSQANILAPINAANNQNVVPITTRLDLFLDLYLVRDLKRGKILSQADLNQASLLSSKLRKHPGIVLSKRMRVRANSIAKEINDGNNSVINATQNFRILDKIMGKKARELAKAFSNTYLYEF